MSPTSYQTAPPRAVVGPNLAADQSRAGRLAVGCALGDREVERPVRLLVRLQRLDQAVDVALGPAGAPTGGLRVVGDTEIVEHAVCRPLGLNLIELRLTLLGGFLGDRLSLGR